MNRSWVFALLFLTWWAVADPVPLVVPLSDTTIRQLPGFAVSTLVEWGIQDALQYDFANQTLDFQIELEPSDSFFSPPRAVAQLIGWAQRGLTLVIGYPYTDMAIAAGKAATTYGVAQLSSIASSSELSDKHLYPYFSRLSATAEDNADAIVDTILRMIETHGMGWSRVALITTSDDYGQGSALAVIAHAENTPIEILIWESFLPGSANLSVEVAEVVNSGAKVIITFSTRGYDVVLQEAEEQGIVDDFHVFMGGLYVTGVSHRFSNGSINEVMVERMRGGLGVSSLINTEGERYGRFINTWTTDGPTVYGRAVQMASIWQVTYDLGVLIVHMAAEARRQGWLDHGKNPTAEQWTQLARSTTVEGSSGMINIDSKGDRVMSVPIVNWRAEKTAWVPVGVHHPDHGVEFFEEIIWRDNTTNFPDLLRAPGYYYWSCDDGKKRYDETGHAVQLQTPDSGGFDEIDEKYICDHFIDCPNMSDESGNCGANYTALFIAFGILTGILILLTCCLIPFVIVFGFIVPRRRVRASSPTFLLIIIFSCLLGFISEYAWFGRAHPVACGFRPWLLGLAVVSLVSALNAKTWRLWRIFKNAFQKERISDLQLVVLYVIMVIPAVLILIIWTIVSTPTAGMVTEADDLEHYVCRTGGFTGEPGGLIFFFILVAYEGFVLLVAAFLCIATRNVPSFFNESKLVAISIYNLGLLAAVVIPVVMVLRYYNPFAAWIIRAMAILYAFSATLLLQFAPKVVGVLVIDRGGDAPLPKLGRTSSGSSSSEFSTNTV